MLEKVKRSVRTVFKISATSIIMPIIEVRLNKYWWNAEMAYLSVLFLYYKEQLNAIKCF
jgi:hypothetical protein